MNKEMFLTAKKHISPLQSQGWSSPLFSLMSCRNLLYLSFNVWPVLEMLFWQNPKAGLLSSVQFSCSVVPDSLGPHGLQHARYPCPSPSPGVYSKSCPLSWWCNPTISPSVIPFSSRLQSFPTSESFPMSQFFASSGRIKYWSFSFSISPSNEHPGLIFFRMDWLDLCAVQGTLKSILQHHSSKASILWRSAFFIV